MKFKEFVTVSHMDDFGDGENVNYVSETSLSRLLRAYDNKKKTFAIISAYRYKNKNNNVNTKQEKIKANRSLRGELNTLNMGVYQLIGHWQECTIDVLYDKCPEDKLKDVVERSYFVPKKSELSDDRFENIILKLTKKYDQDACILYRDGIAYRFLRNGEKIKIVSTLTLGKISQAYSQYIGKPDIPFIFEGVEQPRSISGMEVMSLCGILWSIHE